MLYLQMHLSRYYELLIYGEPNAQTELFWSQIRKVTPGRFVQHLIPSEIHKIFNGYTTYDIWFFVLREEVQTALLAKLKRFPMLWASPFFQYTAE